MEIGIRGTYDLRPGTREIGIESRGRRIFPVI
jgi:hypothetical protein